MSGTRMALLEGVEAHPARECRLWQSCAKGGESAEEGQGALDGHT